jgi:hypothetical protein
MPKITIQGKQVDVNIRNELEQFDWTRADWSADKLLAASPFRYDRSPSFYVYLEDTPSAPAGSWGDSGAYDADYAKGGFVKLLAFLRNETEEETADYLLSTYAATCDGNNLTLNLPRLTIQRNRQPLNMYVETTVSDYLSRRGITEEVQREYGVGVHANAVVLPWRLPDGRLANVKYRKMFGKAFWYHKGAWPIRNLVYGIDFAYKHRFMAAVYTEAEIDAQSAAVAGYCGVGNGGADFNASKRDMILRSPIERLIVMTDNDKAGEKLRAQIESELIGKITVAHAYVDSRYKDVNDQLVNAGVESVRAAIEGAVDCQRGLYVNLRTKVGR